MTSAQQTEAPAKCQIMANTPGTEPLRWYLARRARGLGRRTKRLFEPLLRLGRAAPTPATVPAERQTAAACGELAIDDRVRVRPLEQIRATLDAAGRCGGCAFLEPMARYCGQELRVARRVERFFDERRWRMLKCTNVVLLQGVYCDGSGHPDTRGCDRRCFFFWRAEWLMRVNETQHAPPAAPAS
jgi:hypothetical protein